MARNQTTEAETQPEIRFFKDAGEDDGGGVVGTIGRVYAGIAGFALRRLENFADRRAEARAARVKCKLRSAGAKRREAARRGA